MDWDTLAILLDSMDIILDILTTMASVKLSPRLTMGILTTESALLMLSLRLTPTCCMEDMDTLDMQDTMDTPIALIATMDKLFPLKSQWTANHPCFLYQ